MHLSIGEMQSGGAALLHRLRPRSDRASADPGTAAGTAIRTGPRLAPERDGRDGVRAGARTQSAACRDQQLHERFAPAAGASADPNTPKIEARWTAPPNRRSAPAQIIRRLARFRCAGGIREARRKPFQADRGSRRARSRRRPRARRAASLQSGPRHDQVLVDRVQIQQVLVNLFRNALEAMAHSSRRELIASNMPGPPTT